MNPLILFVLGATALAVAMKSRQAPSGHTIKLIGGQRYLFSASVTPMFAVTELEAFKAALGAAGAKVVSLNAGKDEMLVQYELVSPSTREISLGDVAFQIGRFSFKVLDVVLIPQGAK